jgi:hypothetical protein
MDKFFADKCCEICGENRVVCLDLHHRDPNTKSFTISNAYRLRVGLQTLAVEIAKCDVLCANCHRVQERPNGKWTNIGRDSRIVRQG